MTFTFRTFVYALFVYCCHAGREWVYPPRYYLWVEDNFVNKSIELPDGAPSLSKTFETDPPIEKWWNRSPGGQDLMIVDIYNDKSDGYFVDLAANQYRDSSNTYLLEYFNHWRGVCIEANPMYHAELLTFRRCKLFVNPVSDKINQAVRFRWTQKGGASIVGPDFMNKEPMDQDITLNTTTLEQILDFAKAPSVIDYLSLDIEGAEYHAIKNFPFERYTFWVMTIERPIKKLHMHLVRNGYRYVKQLSGNFGESLYFHQSIEGYSDLMTKHHCTDVPIWFEEAHKYLLFPHYEGFTYPVSHGLGSEEIGDIIIQ